MNDYISREAMLKNLTADLEHHSDEGDPRTHLVMRRFIKYVEDFPAADVQPVDRWISVMDRLPEEEGDVLVWIVDGKPDGIHHLESEYIANWEYGNFYDGDWNVINGITHWQPLPEPPKDGDTE